MFAAIRRAAAGRLQLINTYTHLVQTYGARNNGYSRSNNRTASPQCADAVLTSLPEKSITRYFAS